MRGKSCSQCGEQRHADQRAGQGDEQTFRAQQQKYIHRARADGTQDGQFTPPLVEAGEDDRDQAAQPDHHDHAGYREQGALRDADDLPQLIECDARQHCEQAARHGTH